MGAWESSGTWVALHLSLIALAGLVVYWPVVLIVEQKRAVIVERLGKFHTVRWP